MCDGHSKLLYPYECRERGITYKSKMQAKFCWTVNDGPENSEIKNLGYLPIMVRVSINLLQYLYMIIIMYINMKLFFK